MKKSLKVLLTMVMVVLLFSLTAVVSSAWTLPTEDTMNVSEIDGTNLPLNELNGLPEGAIFYEANVDGDYVVFVGEIENEDSYTGVIAYSENGIDFDCWYDYEIVAATELSNYADSGVYYWDTPTYEDGYYCFPAYFLNEETEEYVDCKVRTSDFVTWECVTELGSSYDYGTYIGEYNGIHIIDCGWYFEGDDYYIEYAISEDGVNWTEKEILVDTEDGVNYEDAVTEIKVTSVGVFFSFDGGIIENSDEVLETANPIYYVTKDFENVDELDIPDSVTAVHSDGSGYTADFNLVVTNVDNKPIFVRVSSSLQLDFETYEFNLKDCTSQIYLYDEVNNKLINDVYLKDCYQANIMPLTEDKYFIWGRNLDGTVTLYEKDGDSFTKSKCKGFSIDDLTIVYDFNVGDDLKLAYAIGVEEYVNLFVTMDEFESIFKFNLPYDYVSILSGANDGMYLYAERYIGDEEYESAYFYITAEELYDYVSDQVSANAPSSNYTGLFKYNGTWYYAKNGTVDFTFTGLHKHTNGIWYYVKDGILDWGFNGLWKHNGVWYGLQKGQINWKYSGLVQHTNGIWYYVQGAKLNWGYTGLVKHNTGSWFYVQKGQINFDYTGLVKHTNGIWYYIENGKLDWGFNGLVKHNGVWYGLVNGQIDWKFVGVIQHTNGIWYYVENGRLNWGYTGLLSCEDGYTYYIQKGQINTNFSGYIKYNGNQYKIENGVVV